MSRLIWIYAVCKRLLLSPVTVEELKRLIHKVRFFFVASYSFLTQRYSSQKGSTLKRKEFAPKGSKFFPFRVDPFSKGRPQFFIELSPMKVNSFPFASEFSLNNNLLYKALYTTITNIQ